MTDLETKLEALRSLVEAHTLRGLLDQGYNPDHQRYECRIKMGRKYANIDVGGSGKYMVELATGTIYGIKAYGVIHRGYCFGTLDAIGEWDWSGYRAVRKQAAA